MVTKNEKSKLKKRAMSMLLSVSMVCSYLPVVTNAVFADTSGVQTEVNAELEAARAAYEKAKSERDAAVTVSENASKERDAADEAFKKAEKTLKDAEAALEKAKKDATEQRPAKEAAVAAAKAELENAKNAQSGSNNVSVDQAASDLAAAKAEYDEAKAVMDQGTLGFFKAMGSTEAVKVIENRLSTQDNSGGEWGKTELGVEGDATSLDNMKLTFDHIRKGNQLRASDEYSTGKDKEPLKVNDYMMAVSQVQTNASSIVIGHSQIYNVAENLAWGHSDPYNGWYDKEKPIWEKQRVYNSDTGHYVNLINPSGNDGSYSVTGFAYVNKSGTKYGRCHGQTFYYSLGSAYGSSYSVDEYESRFDKYYNAAKKALQDAEAKLDAAQKEYDKVTGSSGSSDADSIAKAEAKLAAAEKALADLDTNISDAEKAVSAAEADLDAKKAELAAAGEKLQKALADAESKETAFTAAKSEYEQIKKELGIEDEPEEDSEDEENYVPAKLKISSVKAAKKSLTVKFGNPKDNKIKGYEVQVSTSKSFKKAVKTKVTTNTSKYSIKVSGLKANKKYYVRVRAYCRNGGKKIYSTWSTIKKAKTKR